MADYTITEVPGSWQMAGDTSYQLRGGARKRLVAYVRWYAHGWPQCLTCDANRCEHIAAVRAWRRERAKVG